VLLPPKVVPPSNRIPNNKRATKRVWYFYSYRSHSLLFLVFVASPTAATDTPAASRQPPQAR
jgi:hypothetical protein